MSGNSVVETVVDQSGLRYKSKVNGSPFGNSGPIATMSCFKCGEHRPRALGAYKTRLGRSQFYCGDCSPKNTTAQIA